MPDFDKVVALSDRRNVTNEAKHSNPRDLLLEMLAAIDSGLPVDELILVYDCGEHGFGFKNATASLKNAVGLLQVCQMELHYQGAVQS